MLSKDTIDQIREERNSLERALQKARKELDRAPDELLQYRSSKKGGFFLQNAELFDTIVLIELCCNQ